MRFLYALPVCLAIGLVGCKSEEPAADSETPTEATDATCACGNTECACPACDGTGGECTCG